MMTEHNARLTALRAALRSRQLDGFLIPRSDEHLGEYVPPAAERLFYISGFTGSAGLALVLLEGATIWSDGRYTLQLETQTDATLWTRVHITETPPEDWIKQHAAWAKIGYDPWLISADMLRRFDGIEMIPLDSNPLDEIWTDRPAAPMAQAVPQAQTYAGASSAAKRSEIAKVLQDAGEDAALLTDPASLAWLFNLRGTDVEFTPIALGFAILNADTTASLFMAPEKLPAETRSFLGNQVTTADRAALAPALAALSGKTVRYDPATMPVWFKTTLERAGAKIAEAADPVALPRARKNATEQNGARAAHLRDGVAMVRFLAWLAEAAPTGRETEMSAAARLLAQRARADMFRGESFPAISGAGEDGAIIHYRVTPQTNRAIKPNEVYLIDSGGQYLDGTTDITRTIWTGPDAAPVDIKDHVTRVLAGMIALAQAVFPEGVSGAHLDAFARNALWQAGLDYDHGTGHGVGSYLSVHEGPASISQKAKPVPLQPGMILSDEPGYYLPGRYGIRMENLLLVQEAAFPASSRKFLKFETLTLVPFDRHLILPALLNPAARAWLDAYHARVRAALTPFLQDEPKTLEWLLKATTAI